MAGDPQILEVELAKLKVLVNDIAAHQPSVDSLNEAGAQLVQQTTGKKYFFLFPDILFLED